jgi:hypothetical protein
VSSRIRRHLSAALIALLALLGIWWPVHAEVPDYTLPATFTLPWACGETRRLTWDAFDHWEYGKARGLAFDFSMAPGTPLYAPLSGQAHFLHDERPLETNYGHYIEIIDASGWWMVRLAHLRDPQSGERWVERGELIAHSGSSGVEHAHLHVELLVREGDDWVAPERDSLNRLFGVAAEELIRPPGEGASDDRPIWVTSTACEPWNLIGPVVVDPPRLRVGQSVEIAVPLRNNRLEPASVGAVQLRLLAPDGEEHLLNPEDALVGEVGEMHVTYWPELAGRWCTLGVLYEDDGQMAHLSLDEEQAVCIDVQPSPLDLLGIGPAGATWRVHEPMRIQVEIANAGYAESDEDIVLVWDDLYIEGRDPHGLPWSASAGASGYLDPLAGAEITMYAARLPTKTGIWTIERVGLVIEGRRVPLQQVDQALIVIGPELYVRNLRTFAAPGRFVVFMDLVNVGTEAVAADAVEIWGWEPDGEGAFSAAIEAVPELAPGEAAYLRFEVYVEGRQGVWELVEGGYWVDGAYIALRLPEHDEISLGTVGLARQRRS